MSSFQSGLSAKIAHARLCASLQELQQAEKNAVLWFDEIRRRKLYRQLGYSSIHAYASHKLGFSKARTSQFICLTEALEKLPLLRRSVASGEVPWTKAREVAKVASTGNEREWVNQARQCSRRELERRVKTSRDQAVSRRGQDPAQGSLLVAATATDMSGARNEPDLKCEAPVDLRLRFTPEQYARYEALVEQLRKRGLSNTDGTSVDGRQLPAGREELLLAGLSAGLETETAPTTRKKFPRGNSTPPFQIVVNRCEQCGQSKMVSGPGDLPISPTTMARVECDAQVLVPGERSRATIAPRIRRSVLTRDGYRCRAPGCGSTRFLEVHHIRPRSAGGGNGLDNLLTLCAWCHQLHHEHRFPPGDQLVVKSPPGSGGEE